MRSQALLAIIALLVATPAFSQTRGSSESEGLCAPTLVGQAVQAQFLDVAVEGTIAYVAGGRRGLLMLDISNPTNAVPIAEIDAGSDWAYALEVHAGVAYVATYGTGLKIFDVTNPANPSLLSTVGTTGLTLDVSVSGEVAYLATSWGLEIVDVSKPSKPVKLEGYDGPAEYGVIVSGGIAYVSTSPGLQIIDVTNSARPALLGAFAMPANAFGITVVDNIAYVADAGAGLQIVNVANPANPTLLGTFPTTSAVSRVTILNNVAFVVGSSLWIIDVTKPANPVSIGALFTASGYIHSAPVLANDHLVLANYDKFLTIDITTLSKPSIVSEYEDEPLPSNAEDVALEGNLCAVADHSTLVLLDVSDPSRPIFLGEGILLGSAIGVTLSEGVAYVAAYSAGLHIFDVTDPTRPTILATLDTSGTARDVVIAGDIAYVADGVAGLQIVDVSNPRDPILLATFDTPTNARGVAIVDDIAYVADLGSGLQIIDVSNPSNPTFLGAIGGAHVYGVTVSNHIAYLADGISGLRFVDVTNPRAPAVFFGYDTPGVAKDVRIAAGLAYVADDDSLQIIDVSDPWHPSLKGSFALPATSTDVSADMVAISPNAVYIANQANGAQIVSISGCACPGNVAPTGNSAHTVGVNDLLVVITQWGPCANPGSACTADANFDGMVNVDDLLIVIAGWGPCP